MMKPALNQAMRAAAALMLLTLAACATTGGTAEETVAQRAQARWDALVSGDLSAAYGYLSPAYRSSVNSMQYQRRILLQKVRWTGAEYIDSTCLEESCKVRISLSFSLIGALPGVKRFDGNQEIEENWVKVDGQWWHVPEK